MQTAGNPDRVTSIHSITDAEELKSRIQADLKADIPLEGVSIKTENSYLSSVEISNTSLTLVIQETWTGKPETLDPHQAQIKDEARKILDQPDGWPRFSKRYGEYFVYGFVPRAKFSAIASIKTSSKETRDEIKTSLEVAVQNVGSIGAALESVRANKKESVKIDINVEIVGLKSGDSKGDDETTTTSTNKVEEVQKLYQNFSNNFELQPYIGLLCHYSVSLPKDQRFRFPPISLLISAQTSTGYIKVCSLLKWSCLLYTRYSPLLPRRRSQVFLSGSNHSILPTLKLSSHCPRNSTLS